MGDQSTFCQRLKHTTVLDRRDASLHLGLKSRSALQALHQPKDLVGSLPSTETRPC